jgi:hypothetical protein
VFIWKKESGDIWNLKSPNVSVKYLSPNRSVYGAWSAVQRVCRLYNNLVKPDYSLLRFQVLTAASLTMTAFWGIALCTLETHEHFRGVYCLHHRPDDGGSMYLWNTDRLQ